MIKTGTVQIPYLGPSGSPCTEAVDSESDHRRSCNPLRNRSLRSLETSMSSIDNPEHTWNYQHNFMTIPVIPIGGLLIE